MAAESSVESPQGVVKQKSTKNGLKSGLRRNTIIVV